MTSLITYLKNNNIHFSENIDLKTKTWIKRGGITKLWIQPEKLSDFKKLVVFCHQQNIIFELIGNSSNCYFLNDYCPNVVISTLKLREIEVFDDRIVCDCGYQMSKLAKLCNERGFAGYEGFIGLPGTVGGAVVNNSGCYGSLISDVVKEVTILQDGKLKILTNQQLCYENRISALKRKDIDGVVLSIVFDASKRENPEILRQKAAEYQKHRLNMQEHTYPNLGSTFCKLDFRYSFLQMLVRKILNLTVKIFTRNKLKRQLFSVKIFWLVYFRAGKFKQYVSKLGVQCFTWKDDKADEAFLQYVKFIKENTQNAIMEIEIKGENK